MTPLMLDAEPTPGEVPRVLHRDADLLVVHKPAGWLTHPDGQGRRPDVVTHLAEALGVHQRLDVDTTGVLVFSRTPNGNRRLHAAFAQGGARKHYLAVVDGTEVPETSRRSVGGKGAETHFRVQRRGADWALVEARPKTGRRHQIRSHLAEAGVPIRGDARYGDSLDRRAPRTLLHCAGVDLGDGARFESPAPPEFARYLGLDAAAARRDLRADPRTTAFREQDGGADGQPGWTVDRYGDWLWLQHDEDAPAGLMPEAKGVYGLRGLRDRSRGAQAGPAHLSGEAAPERLLVEEHGVRFLVRLGVDLSTGLFLDQRPQRAWLAQNAAGMRVLNTFAHAGGFSVAAACAGAETVSVDLSRAWLERVPEQLQANGLSLVGHDCIYGDVFDWLRRLGKRGERYDLVILDPPSTSVGQRKKRWSARRDYPELVALAAPLVAPGGRLWTATNHRGISPKRFASLVPAGLPAGVRLERICPPAVDFPCDGPAPVKTFVWRFP
jgi:23S rRNA (cytosine1962-C5)-methyltransferase